MTFRRTNLSLRPPKKQCLATSWVIFQLYKCLTVTWAWCGGAVADEGCSIRSSDRSSSRQAAGSGAGAPAARATPPRCDAIASSTVHAPVSHGPCRLASASRLLRPLLQRILPTRLKQFKFPVFSISSRRITINLDGCDKYWLEFQRKTCPRWNAQFQIFCLKVDWIEVQTCWRVGSGYFFFYLKRAYWNFMC